MVQTRERSRTSAMRASTDDGVVVVVGKMTAAASRQTRGQRQASYFTDVRRSPCRSLSGSDVSPARRSEPDALIDAAALPAIPDKATGRGPWKKCEDERLLALVRIVGPSSWSRVAEYMMHRTAKQCRERYVNHLAPGVVKAEWTPEDEQRLIELQAVHGNHWSVISKHFPGRTDNALKNRYNSYLRRQEYRKKREAAEAQRRKSSRDRKETDAKRARHGPTCGDGRARWEDERAATKPANRPSCHRDAPTVVAPSERTFAPRAAAATAAWMPQPHSADPHLEPSYSQQPQLRVAFMRESTAPFLVHENDLGMSLCSPILEERRASPRTVLSRSATAALEALQNVLTESETRLLGRYMYAGASKPSLPVRSPGNSGAMDGMTSAAVSSREPKPRTSPTYWETSPHELITPVTFRTPLHGQADGAHAPARLEHGEDDCAAAFLVE